VPRAALADTAPEDLLLAGFGAEKLLEVQLERHRLLAPGADAFDPPS
jgi:hypothetical protein